MKNRHILGKITALLCIALLCGAGFCAATSTQSAALQAVYYYFNPCGSCDATSAFEGDWSAAVATVDLSDCTLRTINSYADGSRAFDADCDRLGIPADARRMPMLIVGDMYVSGDDVASALPDVLRRVAEAHRTGETAATVDDRATIHGDGDAALPPELTDVDPGATVLVYFYAASCADCIKVSALLDGLDDTATIYRYNIGEGDNIALNYALLDAYAVPAELRQVPIVFYNGGYLSGYDAIAADLSDVLSSGAARGFGDGLTWGDRDFVDASPWTALVMGLVAGLNPCALSMLLFLLSTLTLPPRVVLRVGLTYTVGRLGAYLAIGLFIYNAVGLLESRAWGGVLRAAYIGIAAVCIVLALLNLRDARHAKRGAYNKIALQLPERLRAFNHAVLARIANGGAWLYPLVFAGSAVVSGGEFLCTGQVYLAGLLYLRRHRGVPFGVFAMYAAAMSVPLVAVLCAVYAGKRLFGVSEFIRARMPLIKTLNALLFIAMAAVVIGGLL